MGAYNSTYIGIYLEIPYTKVEKVITKYKHPTTGNNMSSRFCKDTGVEGIKIENKMNEYVRPSAYIEDVEGLEECKFFSPEYANGGKNIETFILNNDDDFSHRDGDLFNFSMTKSPIGLIDAFKVRYSNYLDYFKDLYGEVNVYYGVVNYAH